MYSLPRSLALAVVLLVLGGCGHPSAPDVSVTPPPVAPSPAEPPAPPPAPAHAETPYTAEQIRDASKVGREWQYRVEQGPKTEWRIMTMTAVDADGATITNTVRGGEGAVTAEPTESRATWEELRAHALFPAAATTISDDSVQTAAGLFQCKRYVVVDGATTSTFWFGNDLPGAPVKLTVESGGAVIETRMLMKHTAGG